MHHNFQDFQKSLVFIPVMFVKHYNLSGAVYLVKDNWQVYNLSLIFSV